jgi:DHA2 family multidrug resistance protein
LPRDLIRALPAVGESRERCSRGDSYRAAIKMLGDLVHREALVLSYNDILLLLGGFFVTGIMLMPLVRRPRPVLTTDRR